MADRKAKEGTPKAAPAARRAARPRKLVKPAEAPVPSAPVLSVKAEPAKTAAPAPVKKAPARKAVKPAAAIVKAPVAAPVAKEAIVPPVSPPVETPIVETPPVETSPVEAPVAALGAAIVEAVETTVATIPDPVKEGIAIMDAKTTATAAADQVQAVFGELNERAKGVMEKNAKIVQEVSDLTKGNVEALVASSRAAAKGIESLSREAAEYSRKSFEDISGTLKSFAEVRSPADFFRLQSDYARSAFDAMVAEGSKLSEQVIKLAGEVAEPITNRYTVAAEKVRSISL